MGWALAGRGKDDGLPGAPQVLAIRRCKACDRIAGKPAPTEVMQNTCGSWLASDAGNTMLLF